MAPSWEKYIEKHPMKLVLKKIIADIAMDHLEGYDIKPLQSSSNKWRIRKGKIRIIFSREGDANYIEAVDTR